MDTENDNTAEEQQNETVEQVEGDTTSDEAAAKIAELTAQLDAKTAELAELSNASAAEIQRLKAVLYDLKNSAGSDDADNGDNDSESDDDEIDIDDLFSE